MRCKSGWTLLRAIAIGTQAIVAYHNLLTQLTITHTWHGDWPGIHDGYYWGGHAADYVHYYGAALATP